MPINVEHTPISAYGRAAYQAGRSIALREQREADLRQQQMAMEQEARNRAFTLQEAASRRAERTLMADIERKGRLDLAGFEEMKERKRVMEQNMADWESLAGTMTEPEYKRGVISIRSGRTPQALQREREPKPVGDVFRAGDRDALFNMAHDYAMQADKAKGREWWGKPDYKQKELIEQYKQFLNNAANGNYADLSARDQQMLELQWNDAMGGIKDEDAGINTVGEFEWDPTSPEVRQARREMQEELGSDTKAELGNYLQRLQRDEGQQGVAEFRKKWANPANQPYMLAMLKKRYGNVR